MNAHAIETESLSRSFGRTRAVDGVSFHVPAGHVVAVLGPNGAGKSTLFRLLLGLLAPSDGRCRVFRHDPRAMPTDELRRIAAVCDRHEPPGWATLRRLIDLQASASPRFDRTFADYLFLSHGLKLGAIYRTLSKGQRRWVLAGLSLASGADLLLFDEPADGLDPSARRELYDYLREYVTQHGATALVATHVISDIERVADDVVIIRHGRLVLHAGIEDLRERVREVEFADTRVVPDLHGSVELLGRQLVNGSVLAWVMGEEPDGVDYEACTDRPVKVRTVNLETLYLALTEHNVDFVPAHEKEARG